MQTANVLQTCQSIHLLGLLVQSVHHDSPLRDVVVGGATETRKDFLTLLVKKGLDAKIAKQVRSKLVI
jgi:hypothetical protein